MFKTRYRRKLELQKQNGLYRNPPPIDRRVGKYIFSNGARLLNFASNDYLGLGACPSLGSKVAENFKRYGSSSSSSRLVSGNFTMIQAAERAYADYFGYEEALFFPSGYQANIGVMSTLLENGDRVLFDKHVHASTVKGLHLSGATLLGYNHSRLAHLEKRLRTCPEQAAVVTESLFSMDGDILDIDELSRLKQQYGFLCIVDEAHAFGVLGDGGHGLAFGVADVAVGTFGKALGLFGAFALMPAQVKSYLLNFSSPQIYTTTLPEAHAASSIDVLERLATRRQERKSLEKLSRWFKSRLKAQGYSISGDAHILAVHIGDETKALQTANRLYERGIYVLPARYPTVPLNRAILRISLTSLHSQADGDLFIEALEEIHDQYS